MKNEKFNVQHFAKLARLELNSSEQEQMQEQMTNILAMIQPLIHLDLDNVKETNFAVDMTNVIRQDNPMPSTPADEVIKTFPDTADNCCKVPVILGDE